MPFCLSENSFACFILLALWDFFQGLTEEEQSSCKEALQGLLDKVYQPLVVRELLLLQGVPKRV